MLEPKNLENNYYELSTYHTYLGTDKPVVRIQNKNKNNNNSLKILFIKDSYDHVVAPFLACICGELLLVDLRPSQKIYFDGNIRKLIEKERPDLVLMFYHCGSFNPTSKDRFHIH